MRKTLAACLLLAVSLLATHAARASPGDLNRCVGPDGRSVYTDKPCTDVGATVRPEAPKSLDGNSGPPPLRVHVHDCARTLEALRDGVGAAVAAGDVNKFASFYHWPGIGNAGAEGILKRMQGIASRPLVSVALSRAHAGEESDSALDAPPPSTATGIVIAQTRSAGDPTPEHTYLGVTAYMGCWWVRF